jgi:myo-inositol 2-dehydrogenase/D-chiro-inositol 1-dehydrogenase
LFPFERVEVFCHHSTLVTREMETLVCSTNIAGHFTEQSMQQLSREEKWGYLQEDRAFIDAIMNNTPPLVTAFDGLMSVKLVEAVYESVEVGSCEADQRSDTADLREMDADQRNANQAYFSLLFSDQRFLR